MKKGFTQVVVLAIIRQENKYLLTLRNDQKPEMNKKWQIAGGGHEFGELPEETLHREVMEELGTTVQLLHKQPVIDTRIRGKWQGIFIGYLCELIEASSKIKLNEEASEYEWFTVDEMRELDVLDGCVDLVERTQTLTL